MSIIKNGGSIKNGHTGSINAFATDCYALVPQGVSTLRKIFQTHLDRTLGSTTGCFAVI